MSIRCPKCGAELVLIAIDDLTPVARAVLEWAQLTNVIVLPPIENVAEEIAYSPSSVHRAMGDLTEAGYFVRIPTGPRKGKYAFIKKSH